MIKKQNKISVIINVAMCLFIVLSIGLLFSMRIVPNHNSRIKDYNQAYVNTVIMRDCLNSKQDSLVMKYWETRMDSLIVLINEK